MKFSNFINLVKMHFVMIIPGYRLLQIIQKYIMQENRFLSSQYPICARRALRFLPSINSSIYRNPLLRCKSLEILYQVKDSPLFLVYFFLLIQRPSHLIFLKKKYTGSPQFNTVFISDTSSHQMVTIRLYTCKFVTQVVYI